MNAERTKHPDLDAIRARAEAASAGPWTTHRVDEDDYLGVAMDQGVGWVAWVAEECIQRPGDAEFIAHAREDVPALLAEIERLREIVRDFASLATTYIPAARFEEFVNRRAALAAQESAE